MMRTVVTLLALCMASACERSKIDESEWKAKGAEAVEPFKKQLKEALVAGLQEGPVQAIAVCRVEPWMKPFLDRYENHPDQREPAAVLIDANTVGYVEPIFVQPLCVTCHGANLAPDLRAKIEELYPSDQATGYAPGDLRGIFWAELARE
jgi:hypothetical protein